jgi:hypothetical protein
VFAADPIDLPAVSEPIRLTRPETRAHSGVVDSDARDRLCLARTRAAETRSRDLIDGFVAGLRRQLELVADGLIAKVDILGRNTAKVGRRIGRLHADVRRMFLRIERLLLAFEARLADLERRHAVASRGGCRRARTIARRRH